MGTIREKNRKDGVGAADPKEIENMLPEDFDTLFQTTPLTSDTTCGYWMCRGLFQR